MNTRSFLFGILVAALVGESQASDLDGHWIESNNFPASSVIRFSSERGLWTGKYSQVSALQKDAGFKVGEPVIRGKFDGKVFKGEVFLRARNGEQNACANLVTGWRPIEMHLIESDRLYGAWLQVFTRTPNNCEIVAQKWQIYGLERLKLN